MELVQAVKFKRRKECSGIEIREMSKVKKGLPLSYERKGVVF